MRGPRGPMGPDGTPMMMGGPRGMMDPRMMEGIKIFQSPFHIFKSV
jgi:hypothetical protein